MIDTGHGATITFGTSGQSFRWTQIKLPKETRPVVPTDHLGSSKMTKMPGDLPQFDQCNVDFQFDSSQALPLTDNVPQTVTVTFPLAAGDSTAATYAGTAMIVGVDTPSFQSNTLQTGTIEIEFDCETGPTFTPSS